MVQTIPSIVVDVPAPQPHVPTGLHPSHAVHRPRPRPRQASASAFSTSSPHFSPALNSPYPFAPSSTDSTPGPVTPFTPFGTRQAYHAPSMDGEVEVEVAAETETEDVEVMMDVDAEEPVVDNDKKTH